MPLLAPRLLGLRDPRLLPLPKRGGLSFALPLGDLKLLSKLGHLASKPIELFREPVVPLQEDLDHAHGRPVIGPGSLQQHVSTGRFASHHASVWHTNSP